MCGVFLGSENVPLFRAKLLSLTKKIGGWGCYLRSQRLARSLPHRTRKPPRQVCSSVSGIPRCCRAISARAQSAPPRCLELPLAVGRDAQGRAFALSDLCPHRAMPLSFGRVAGDTVECCYHGWKFDAHSGQCRAIPSLAGAKLLSIDESSVRNMPGFLKVVSKGNYVAVVCEREEQAINAARKLKANWQKPDAPLFPPSEDLFNYIRGATPTSAFDPVVVGDPDTAFKGAAKVIEAEYEVPFQGHTAISPAHATADPSNGQMTIYSNDMKSYGMRTGVAQFLGMPRDKVRVVWMEGPQGYGRTAADDAGCEAAYLAKELNRPVRVQWMRNEETAWDTKGPAFVVKVRGGLDAQGNLVAYDYHARAADYNHLGYNEPDTVLIAQLMGSRRATPAKGGAAMPSEMYAIPNRRMTAEVVSLPAVWETPVRTGNLRDPNGPQSTFPAESFIDELAAAANADPYEFRLKMLMASAAEDDGFRRSRSIAVLKTVAETYGWDRRPSPKPIGTGKILTGRGISYAFRNQTVVANSMHTTGGRCRLPGSPNQRCRLPSMCSSIPGKGRRGLRLRCAPRLRPRATKPAPCRIPFTQL